MAWNTSVLVLGIPPDWVNEVRLTRTWPTAILGARNGREQRMALATGVRESLSYHLAGLSASESNAIAWTLQRAMHAIGTDRLAVRVPFWPDALRLRAPAESGDSVLLLDSDEDATLRRFVSGQEVYVEHMGWQAEPTVLMLADEDAIVADELLLSAPLAIDLPAGTLIAPIVQGRLTSRIEGEDYNGRHRRVSLNVALDANLAGLGLYEGPSIYGVGTPGNAMHPVVASIEVREQTGNSVMALRYGQQLRLRATCFDVNGMVIPQPRNLIWTFTPGTFLNIVIPNPHGPFCNVEGLNVGHVNDHTLVVTDPVSGVSSGVYPFYQN